MTWTISSFAGFGGFICDGVLPISTVVMEKFLGTVNF
jgi:hypothetical protein